MLGSDLVWDSWAPLRIKLFLWLALRKRLWTADRRRRHGLEAQDNCYLCDQEPESIDHIIVQCSYAKQVWWFIRSALQETSQLQPTDSIYEWWRTWRAQWQGQCRQGADSIFTLVACELWKERNVRCFRGANTQVADLLKLIKYEADMWIAAGAKNLGCLMQRVVH
jgi:hypothetical protein